MFEITAIPAFRDNYIWGLHQGCRAALVDPGEAVPALAWLEREGLQLEAILITHHHQDHQGGVAELLARYPETLVFGSGAESITGLGKPLAGGECIRVLDTEFQVRHAPGHTLGHLLYLTNKVLFCGDTLFGAGCGRLFEGTPEQMYGAMEWILALPDDTLVYCAHEYTLLNLPFAALVEPGNPAIEIRRKESERARAQGLPTVPSVLGLEKATNPFLRCHVPEVMAQAREHCPGISSTEQVFACLRAWRDEF